MDNHENVREEVVRLCDARKINKGIPWKVMVDEIGNDLLRTKNIDEKTLKRFYNSDTYKPDEDVLRLIRAWVIKKLEEERSNNQ